MPRGLHLDGPERLSIKTYEPGPMPADAVRIHVEFAAIKHGTLFHMYSGHSPFAGQRFDSQSRLFVADPNKAACSPGFAGNMVVGVVDQVGANVSGVKPGERIFGYATCRETADLHEWWPLGALDPRDAVCTDPGAYGLVGILDGNVLFGESVIVFGMGAIGLMAVQFLKANGVHNIAAVDPVPARQELARRFGATVIDPLKPGLDLGLLSRELTGGHGFDLAIECSGRVDALAQSIRTVRMCGRICSVGFYEGAGTPLHLGAEWLHNRLEMICPMPEWGNPMRQHPRWTLRRLRDTVIEALRRGQVSGKEICGPITTLDEAPTQIHAVYKDSRLGLKCCVRFS